MYITILFIATGIIAIYSYQNTVLKLLSPTFWASVSVCAFSGVYVLTYSTMINDISLKTLLIFLGAIFSVALGCYTGNRIVIRTKGKRVEDGISLHLPKEGNQEILIAKWKTVVVFVVYLFIAIVRFRNLLTMSGGNFLNLLEAMSTARYYVTGSDVDVVLSNTYLNQILYACEIATFIHIYLFLHNLVVLKKKHLYLLLPLIPDCMARLVTTSRSSFLVLLFAFITCYCFVCVRRGRTRNVLITPKTIVIISAFFVVFFAYGRVRNDLSISLLDNVQMYTSSAIYNFDYYIQNGWNDNPYFGFYTLQKIYDLFRVKHSYTTTTLPMNVFNTHHLRANIYTSLFQTVQDYSVWGMLLLRFFETLIGTLIIRKALKAEENDYRIYYMLYFVIIIIYCFVNFPIGNRFGDYLGNPTVLFRYLLYGWILVKFFLKPILIDYDNS